MPVGTPPGRRLQLIARRKHRYWGPAAQGPSSGGRALAYSGMRQLKLLAVLAVLRRAAPHGFLLCLLLYLLLRLC